MTTSLTKSDSPILTISKPPTLEGSRSLIKDTLPEEERDDRELDSFTTPGIEPLSDKVIGLREWGAGRVFSLRAPQHSRDTATADATELQLTRGDLATTDRIEIVYESQSWRIKDWSGLSNLKQDGRPTREVSLMPGTEVAIAGRTFIAESARSIALRNFCSRLLGWDSDRIAVVDHALRAIRLAGAGRAPLMLAGGGDLN